MNICNNSGLAVLVAICVNIDNTVSYTHISQYIYIDTSVDFHGD